MPVIAIGYESTRQGRCREAAANRGGTTEDFPSSAHYKCAEDVFLFSAEKRKMNYAYYRNLEEKRGFLS